MQRIGPGKHVLFVIRGNYIRLALFPRHNMRELKREKLAVQKEAINVILVGKKQRVLALD